MRYVSAALLGLLLATAATADGTPPPDRFRLRKLKLRGNTPDSEKALTSALEWLAKHQDSDGSWMCDAFDEHDPADDRCDGRGRPAHTTGVTALAVLAFLGAGHTDAAGGEAGMYAATVAKGLAYLASIQQEDGYVGLWTQSESVYGHAIAALALAEGCWLSAGARHRDAAAKAMRSILAARHPDGGWSYSRETEVGDASVTGWCAIALRTAQLAGLEPPPESLTGARRQLDMLTDLQTGRCGYRERGSEAFRPESLAKRFPASHSEAMTGVAVFAKIALGDDPLTGPGIPSGSQRLLAKLPRTDPAGAIDMYYWLWGSLAIHEVGSPAWPKWEPAMRRAIVKLQRTSGAEAGSWDPVDPWGAEGGRVYATAIVALTLETYYRYDGVFRKPAK